MNSSSSHNPAIRWTGSIAAVTLAVSLVGVSSASADDVADKSAITQTYVSTDPDLRDDLLEVWSAHHPGRESGELPPEVSFAETERGLEFQSAEDLEAVLIAELESSDLERSILIADGEIVTTYRIPGGPDISVVRPLVTPMVWGGSDAGGIYVTFSAFDQNLIVSGHGFVLAAAICAIPAVGAAACLVAGALITAATVYITTYNVCKSPRSTLKIYPFKGMKASCVRP